MSAIAHSGVRWARQSALLLVAAACSLGVDQHAYASSARIDYMLGCQGCHLADGRGYPARGVPALTGFVGKFATVPGGREFLVQVPGVAQSTLPDDRLAAVLNWTLLTFSRDELPHDFVPFGAEEVGLLRRAPLASVADTRADLLHRIEQREAVGSASRRAAVERK